ncbi:uncharacterized protein CDV56_103745 [Aspergillus thermomutatus]|uniref:Uncharacterized protein n=1 Tax=Aspergillus thermomutatus TaxID=41047 RepID=A0A397GQS7_ASPTH|nr:uncharacterized protein CDV56_103745 [Aspergillus thermomutatus]RHZ50380.1 hypothetical protein CDV56_103745 [Aspergillus thermomutatus]
MFPPGDPFVYSTQPMSTLEADHFQHDLGMPAWYPFDLARQDTGMGRTTLGDPNVVFSIPNFGFTNLPGFPRANPPGIKSSVVKPPPPRPFPKFVPDPFAHLPGPYLP